MKKLLLIIIFFMAQGSLLKAQNTMTLSSAEGNPDDIVDIELSVNNTDSFIAFQADIPLGENLTYVENSAKLFRDNGHYFSATVVDGTLKIFAYSLANIAFSGNEGKLVSFQLKLGSEPGSNTLTYTKAKLVSASNTELPLTTTDGSVLIAAPKLQITTSQINYGHVPIRSTYTQSFTVKNIGNEPLNITELQFSDETLSCPSFAEKTLAVGAATSFSIVYSPVLAGAVNYTITVKSDAANGDQSIKVIADPYSVNELHIESTSDYCDSIVDINIKVNNMDAITGFQFFIKMPTALQYQAGSFELSSRKVDHIPAASMRNDTLVMMAYSTTNTNFSGEDGVIASFKVKIKGNSGYHYLYPKNVILTDANAVNVMSGAYSGYVYVRSPKINVASIQEFEASSVTEVAEKLVEIKNASNAPLRIDSVKFSDDYLSCTTNLPLVIKDYSSANISLQCDKETEGDFQSTMRIYSNDPTVGLVVVKVKGNRYEPNGLSIDNEPVTSMKYLDVLVDMNNYSEITAVQADFSYPNEDYTLMSSDFSLTDRCSGFSLTAVATNDSTFKIIMYSLSNAIISGNEGSIIKIKLTRKDGADNETATVSLKNIILSDVKGNNKDSEGDKIKKIELKTVSTKVLSAGWNWFSTNIDISGEEGFEMLKQTLGDNAFVVKSQMEFVKYYDEYDMWSGSLTTIDNGNMYKINMKNEHTITMQGFLTDALNFNLTLQPGWNWISYPLNEELNLNDIDFGFTPKQGDYIKSRDYFARYYEGYGWSGSLEVLKPGEGYIYNNTDEEEKILKYSKKNN